MKVIVRKDYEYFSGWVKYKMFWRTKYTGIRNTTLLSVVAYSKVPFSTKAIKKTAATHGYDLDELFTDDDKFNEDLEKLTQFSILFNEWNDKNKEEMNSDSTCYGGYFAALDEDFKPIETPFMTIQVYKVCVRIEFKSYHRWCWIYSLGRDDNDEEAIKKINSRIEKDIADCDTEEKFHALVCKLDDIEREMYDKIGIHKR